MISDQKRNEINQIQKRLDDQNSSPGDNNIGSTNTASAGASFDSAERGAALHG